MLVCALHGCADGADCGEGMVLETGSCFPDGTGSGDGDDDDAGTGTDAATDTPTPGRPSADDGFGDVCSDDVDHSDCTGAADYCGIMSGTEGTCTTTGCAEDETVCPEGWGCFDLSAFDPTLPSICTAP